MSWKLEAWYRGKLHRTLSFSRLKWAWDLGVLKLTKEPEPYTVILTRSE